MPIFGNGNYKVSAEEWIRQCSSSRTANAAGPGCSVNVAPRRCAGGCPVMAPSAGGPDVGEPYGIWGGLSETERELLLKRGDRPDARHPPQRLVRRRRGAEGLP